MQNRFIRWVFVLVLIALLSCIPWGNSFAAHEGQMLDDPYPTFQTDSEIETPTQHTLYLILGAFLIVLVILGAMVLRRPKS